MANPNVRVIDLYTAYDFVHNNAGSSLVNLKESPSLDDMPLYLKRSVLSTSGRAITALIYGIYRRLKDNEVLAEPISSLWAQLCTGSPYFTLGGQKFKLCTSAPLYHPMYVKPVDKHQDICLSFFQISENAYRDAINGLDHLGFVSKDREHSMRVVLSLKQYMNFKLVQPQAQPPVVDEKLEPAKPLAAPVRACTGTFHSIISCPTNDSQLKLSVATMVRLIDGFCNNLFSSYTKLVTVNARYENRATKRYYCISIRVNVADKSSAEKTNLLTRLFTFNRQVLTEVKDSIQLTSTNKESTVPRLSTISATLEVKQFTSK